ncbi:MAG: ABC transporter permease [Chloroflexota bacterium]
MATATQVAKIVQEGPEARPRSKSLAQRAMYRIRRDKLTLISLLVLLVMAVLSYSAPFITNQILQTSYTRPDPINKYLPVGTEGHLLGTDELGRDHLARLLYGGRVSLTIGFSAAILSMTIGVAIGVTAGYYGGPLDDFIIWFVTTLNSLPSLFLLLMISAVLSPGPVSLILVLSFLGWTGEMRLMRGEALRLREQEFTLAARSVGAGAWRIMFIHIAPNAISLLLITLMRSIGGIILAESSLSFLGFGIKPPIPSWGNMLSNGLELLRLAPHLVIAPGLLITITVLCLYIIGDGLRDAFDPRIAD